jgi:hypothetical protein
MCGEYSLSADIIMSNDDDDDDDDDVCVCEKNPCTMELNGEEMNEEIGMLLC